MIKSGYLAIISYYLCQLCVQCSILAFYLRIGVTKVGGHLMQRTIHALMALSVVNNIAGGCIHLAFTMPVPMIMQSKKYLTPFLSTYCSINLLMDITIWTIPLPCIFSILHQLSTRKKILLILAFALGTMSWCSAILRISLRSYVVGLGTDPTYYAPITYVLLVAEVSLAISVVSLATFKPLVDKMTEGFNRLRGKILSTNNSTSTCFESGASPGLAQAEEYGPRPGGSKTTGNESGFAEHTDTTIDQERMEWNNCSDIEGYRSQFVQETCSYSSTSGSVELESIEAHDHALGTLPQVPSPAAIALHHSSSSSRGDPLPSSESTVNLTNVATDTNSTTAYPRSLVSGCLGTVQADCP